MNQHAREIFLTGATGVLGSQLAFQWLEQPRTKLWLLMRAGSHAALRERAAELIGYLTGLGARAVESRVECVRGDAEAPRFGMSDEDYARVSRAITHVVHAAGDVHFDRTLDEARATAISGVENAIALARAGDAPRKLEYVSTVGVAGRRDGWIFEEPQPIDGRGYRNSYEHAKAEAEQYLLAQVQRGLPATIHRPTMIVGDSRTGQIRHPQAFQFIVDYFLGRRGDRVVPACSDTPIDTIPVDYVARAIECSLERPHFAGEILHLGSGTAALRVGELVARAQTFLERRGVARASLTQLDLDHYAAHVAARCAEGSRFHRALAQFQPYFGDLIEFDNRRARALLEPEGIAVPSVDSYLERVLERHWSHWSH